MNLRDYLNARAHLVNRALDTLLPAETTAPETIHRAMRYSVFAGGKRLRPILCLAAADIFDERASDVLPVACALELIHTYSLVHDDLPAMDDDDLRRGRPTCHKVFGEAMAILAGDALLTHAFTILAERCGSDDDGRRLRVLGEIARAASSTGGMIGGQVFDMLGETEETTADRLDQLHLAKTGALLTASVTAGAIQAGATASDVATLRRFGASIGLAFQIADDVLDVTSTADELGKTPGKDVSAGKATYPALYGLAESQRRAAERIEEAYSALNDLGRRADRLREIAAYVVERRN